MKKDRRKRSKEENRRRRTKKEIKMSREELRKWEWERKEKQRRRNRDGKRHGREGEKEIERLQYRKRSVLFVEVLGISPGIVEFITWGPML